MAVKILSKEKLAVVIAARNAEFKAATRPGKRVVIAKDVIAQIKRHKLMPRQGTWLRFTNFNNPDFSIFDNGEDSIKDKYLDNTVQQCEGCALGSLMLSCTLFNNKLKFGENDIYDNIGEAIEEGQISNGLDKIFSTKQLALIELAFEQGSGYFSDDIETHYDYDTEEYKWNYTTEQERAVKFGKKYESSTKRLTAIMNNIIENDGKFVP